MTSFLVPTLPGSNEQSTYNRRPIAFFFTTRSFVWKWAFSAALAVYPAMRLLAAVTTNADGTPNFQPVSPFVTPTTNGYTFNVTMPADGHYLASVEGAPAGTIILAKPFLVNASGSPLPLAQQTPWTASNRRDLEQAWSMQVAQTRYPGAPPEAKRWPLKARTIEPYSTLLPDSQLWIRRISENQSGMNPEFCLLPTGDVCVERWQKYFYADATTFGNPPTQGGLMAPPIGVRDGARGVEQLGFVSKAIMRFDGKGSYFIESQGRVGFKIFDSPFLPPVGVDMSKSQFTGEPGESGTFAGRRAKKHQLRQTASLITAGAVTSAQRAKYEEQWEMVGDWSRVPWGAGFRELWGGAVAFRNADGTINNRFGLELWIPDAMGGPDGQGVIYYVNQWPAHPAKRTLAQFPPKGYTDAGTVTGQADVVPFLTHEQWPDYVNQPFDMELGPDGKLYWINFGNHSLCRCDLDGGNPEEVVSCSIGVVDGPLGIPYRLADATMATDQIRALYVKDGPFGTATLMYPQTMRFTSKGTIVIGERYTYALREVDLTARTVRTIAYIPNLAFAGTSSGCNDLGMDVDHAGTCGPVDDIFVSVWLRNYRFGLDGTYRGYPFTPAGAGYMSNGPLPRIQCPVYAWTPGVGNGRIFFVGSGGGHQAIEITKRQTGDVGPDSNADYTKWTAGRVAFQNSPMYLTHGCALQGRLGYPSIEEIGSWTEATLRSYATTWGISAANMDNFVYFARMGSMDYDYAVDTTAPAKPVNALSESSITWS